MKILHLCSGLSEKQGGTTVAVKSLCKALTLAGMDITVVTTDAGTDINLNLKIFYKQTERDGFKIFYFHSPCFKSYGFSPYLLLWLKKNITKFDIVHMHPIFNLSSPFAASLCRKHSIPYIISPSGMLNSYWAFRRNALIKKMYLFIFEKRNLNLAKAIHFTSKQESEDAKRLNLKIPSFVIPWGLDMAGYDNPPKKGYFRERYGIAEDKKIILFLSRVDPKKGLEYLIPALAKLFKKRDNFVFVLAGSGKRKYEIAIKRLLYKNKILDKTYILGFVDGQDELSLLRDSDIFILPSFYENFGYAVVEAMASGLPVMVSKFVDIYPDIIDYKAGIVTDIHEGQISAGLEKLLEDDSLRRQMGESGKRLVGEIFNWNKIGPRFIELYKRCLVQ